MPAFPFPLQAISQLINKPTPALTHALTTHSLSKTPLAALSRSVTGICAAYGTQTLLITLPGSPKAVKEYLEILLDPTSKVLLHALQLLSNQDVSTIHNRMQGDLSRTASLPLKDHAAPPSTPAFNLGSCSCCKSETSAFISSDPAAGPSRRARQSPYPMVSLDEALHSIDAHSTTISELVERKVQADLVGHVLAEDVIAEGDIPPRPTSNVDGYAVNSKEVTTGAYQVIAGSDLGTTKRADDHNLKVHRVNTGQPLPEGTDAMVMVEDTDIVARTQTQDGAAGEEEETIDILSSAKEGDHVRAQGSDLRHGDFALRKGTLVSALGGELGTLCFVGRRKVKVTRKPVVGLLSTGNELLDPAEARTTDHAPSSFYVFDSNRPGLMAAVQGQGFSSIDLGIVEDDRSKLIDRLKNAMSKVDIVVTTGGTSMGESDLLKSVLERDIGAKVHFGRVAMKPGKPTTFASVNQGGKSCLLFALPGNPASAMVCFYVFVLPALRKLAGYPGTVASSTSPQESPPNPWSLPRIKVQLGMPVSLDPRPEFHRVQVQADREGALWAKTTGAQRSR